MKKKLVIEIDDEVYSHVKDVENRLLTPNEESVLRYSVANGTPLSEGHGRLIDADSFVQEHPLAFVRDVINDAPTIIEADGGEDSEVSN